MKPSSDFNQFVKLVRRLRKECPWDRKQTHHSIKDNMIEEVYEVIEAIDDGDMEELKRELGDLLLHVVFHSTMASESDSFTVDEVIHAISEKLIRRHPHVFENKSVGDEQDIAEQWEKIKLSEGKQSTLEGLPAHLPALIRAFRIQEKASNVGFDWMEWTSAWQKLDEELSEWRETLESEDENQKRRNEEFGDLLFSLVNVGRLLGLNAEEALRAANRKFESRFRYIEDQLSSQNRSPRQASLEQMDELWNEAKRKGR